MLTVVDLLINLMCLLFLKGAFGLVSDVTGFVCFCFGLVFFLSSSSWSTDLFCNQNQMPCFQGLVQNRILLNLKGWMVLTVSPDWRGSLSGRTCGAAVAEGRFVSRQSLGTFSAPQILQMKKCLGSGGQETLDTHWTITGISEAFPGAVFSNMWFPLWPDLSLSPSLSLSICLSDVRSLFFFHYLAPSIITVWTEATVCVCVCVWMNNKSDLILWYWSNQQELKTHILFSGTDLRATCVVSDFVWKIFFGSRFDYRQVAYILGWLLHLCCYSVQEPQSSEWQSMSSRCLI